MSTLLLVEDETLLREGIQEILEAHGYVVIGAADGVEAIEWLGQVTVHLIVTDLFMPNMNGVEFIEHVSANHPQTPVIVISGSTGTAMKRMGIESIHVPGATASIMKPFKAAELVALIQKVLAAT
ncbi:MAG: response regulator [Pseudomonadota bacterium]|jgi:CheY-like chemotaxis protein